MLTKEKFKDLVYKMLEHNEFYDKLYDLGIDAINCKYMETAGIMFDELMKAVFGEDGVDLISWWMYEDVDHVLYEPCENKNNKDFYLPGEEIPHGKVIADLNHIDDLYDYLVDGGRDGLDE